MYQKGEYHSEGKGKGQTYSLYPILNKGNGGNSNDLFSFCDKWSRHTSLLQLRPSLKIKLYLFFIFQILHFNPTQMRATTLFWVDADFLKVGVTDFFKSYTKCVYSTANIKIMVYMDFLKKIFRNTNN